MLKVIMLRKRIDDAKKALAKLMEEATDLEKREEELGQAIEEAETEEEKKAVEEAVEQFDADKEANEAEKSKLDAEINEMEEELRELEEKQDAPAPQEAPKAEERKDTKKMVTRAKIFKDVPSEELRTMFESENVKAFLGTVREHIKSKRAISNVGLLIPEEFLGVLQQNVINYSKLYKHITVRTVGGDSRLVIAGAIPEAIWTEACANLNELDLAFNDVELDGYKVGGFIPVCNAQLEDSDFDLAGFVLDALAQAIGYALDKAILYGTGIKMPLGIVTRLAQTSQPAGYPDTARTWVDLHTSNIKTTANTGVAMFQDILINGANADGKYARGEKVWVMNEKTYTYLRAQGLSVNASGAIVSAIDGTMPVAGGIVEVLNFIPDYNIIGGYFELYMLGERRGIRLAQSEHVRFLADETVFKGTARYDGTPVIPEAFVVLGVNNTAGSTSITIADDSANKVQGIYMNTSTASVVVGHDIQLKAFTFPVEGNVEWSSATTGKATVGSTTGVVTGVASGSSVITATCGDYTAQCTVTVTTE